MYRFLVFAVSLVSFSSAAFAARWTFGGAAPNQIDVPESGRVCQVVIGDNMSSDNQPWSWSNARGIGFFPSKAMPVGESSSELKAGKIAGGTCCWEMSFHFSRPVSRFRFETPLCTGVALEKGDFCIKYAVNSSSQFHELWRYGISSPGFEHDKPIRPQWTDWVTLDSDEKIQDITLRFELDGYVREMHFCSDTADGGVLEYIADETLVFIPDAADRANIYYVDEPPAVLLPSGALEDQVPDVNVYDLGRNQVAGACALALSNGVYHVKLPELQAGAYELQVTPDGFKTPVLTHRFSLVLPAGELTLEQARHSPFGIKGIARTTPFRKSAALNGPLLAKMIGSHQIRGGLGSWVEVNKSPGVYQWDESRFEKAAEDTKKYGLVYRGYLDWTPKFAVDPARVQKGHWFGHYPPRPEYLPDYAEFCKQAAARVRGLYVPEFEVWNEPNNEPYGSWKGTFEEFVQLNKTAADAVLSVNPDARMVLGSTGGTDAGYLVRLFKAGLADQFRIVDIHPYRHSDRGPEDGLLVDIRRVQKVIDLYGNNQSIIFTEIGWPTYTEGRNGMYAKVTQFQQACYFSRTLLISLAAGVERVHFHMLTDWGTDPSNPEHNFGAVDIYGRPKLALSALSTTQRQLEQSRFKGVVSGFPAFHHVWAWDTPWKQDATLFTVWFDSHNGKYQPEWIDLPGTVMSVEDLWGGADIPETRLRKTETGWRILPGEDPFFVVVSNPEEPDLESLPTAMRSWHLRRLDKEVGVKQIDAVPVTDQAVAVDGDVSEWNNWPGVLNDDSGGSSIKGMGYAGVEEGVGKEEQGAAQFAVAYSEQGLLFAARVNDDTPMQNDFDHFWVWRGDHIRLNLSPVDRNEYPYISENHFQIDLAPITTGGGPAQAVQTNPITVTGMKQGELVPGALVAARKVEGGWTLEALIPWAYLNAHPSAGDVWSFDVTAAGHVWNGGPNNWNNPLLWGNLKFNNKD